MNEVDKELKIATDLDRSLEAGTRQFSKNEFVVALKHFAALLIKHPEDPRPYREASRALMASLDQASDLSAWNEMEKSDCYRRLLFQERCPVRPLIFHHIVASHLTSASDTNMLPKLVLELTPTLQDILSNENISKNLVVFLLIVRMNIGDLIAQNHISSLHLERFPKFEPEDLALPYSVMFFPATFGRNRDDVVTKYLVNSANLFKILELGPYKVLFLEWLTGHDFFKKLNNTDFLDFLAQLLEHSDRSEYELGATRSLIIRHWNLEGVQAPEAVVKLGLDANLIDLVRLLRPVQERTTHFTGSRLGASLLQFLPYQAFQAARSLASIPIPALSRNQKRVRVAVCVSGQLRGFKEALASWRRTIFGHADCDFFVHTWSAIGRSEAQPFRHTLPFEGRVFKAAYRKIGTREGYESMQIRYPSLFSVLSESGYVTADDLRETYGTSNVIVEDDRDEVFSTYSNQQKMHYKIWASYQLAIEAENDYDLFVRIRPDLKIRVPAFDWNDLAEVCQASPCLYSEKKFGMHYGNPMIGDQFAVGSGPAMKVYAETWLKYPQVASYGMAKCEPELRGHVSLAHICWLSGFPVLQAPIKFGRLCDPEPLSSANILQALSTDAESRMDTIDQELIHAARDDLRH